MKVGDLIVSNMWFAARKRWDEKRIGLIINKFDPADDVGAPHKGIQFEIMWQDNTEGQWYGEDVLSQLDCWKTFTAPGNHWVNGK